MICMVWVSNWLWVRECEVCIVVCISVCQCVCVDGTQGSHSFKMSATTLGPLPQVWTCLAHCPSLWCHLGKLRQGEQKSWASGGFSVWGGGGGAKTCHFAVLPKDKFMGRNTAPWSFQIFCSVHPQLPSVYQVLLYLSPGHLTGLLKEETGDQETPQLDRSHHSSST